MLTCRRRIVNTVCMFLVPSAIGFFAANGLSDFRMGAINFTRERIGFNSNRFVIGGTSPTLFTRSKAENGGNKNEHQHLSHNSNV